MWSRRVAGGRWFVLALLGAGASCGRVEQPGSPPGPDDMLGVGASLAKGGAQAPSMTGVSAGRPSVGTGGVGMIPMPDPGAGGVAGFGGEPQVGGAPPDLPPGISDHPITLDCTTTCSSAPLLGGDNYVDPCCTVQGACGLHVGILSALGVEFLERCQPKGQPGVLDSSCRAKSTLALPVGEQAVLVDPLPGCCQPTGTCGVMVNQVSVGGGVVPVAEPGWGCMDAAPFFAGAAPQSCGGEGGAGGAAGQGFGGAPDVPAGGWGPEGGAGN